MRDSVEENPTPKHDEDNDPVLGLDFRHYLDTLRKYAWAVVAIIALAIAVAVVYTNRQPRVYAAQASIQIEPRIPDLLGQGQEILTGLATANTLDYYKHRSRSSRATGSSARRSRRIGSTTTSSRKRDARTARSRT
jgi:uncharacterized protein involved in exopolysaccharide biosynthesis